MLYPSNYVSHVGDIDFNLTSQNCTYGAVCYNKLVNFNNYDAIAITVHTENTQQTGTQLMVGRGANTTMMIGAGTAPYTISYEESTFVTMTNTTAQHTYVFNCNDLRQEDVDTGYLGICVKRGNADGHVYIDKIVVYKDGDYYDNEVNDPEEEPEDPIPCTYIVLDQSELTFNSIGIGQVLNAAVTPTNTTDTIVWTTNDNTVATVENGMVRSVGEGTCKITATCGSQKVSCYVTVDLLDEPEEEPDGPENIPCTYIVLDNYNLYFDYIPYTQQLNAAVTPANTTDTIIWSTNNSNVATVENGIVKSVGEGTCKITATCGSQHVSCNVTVEVDGGDTNKPCTGIHISPNTVQLGKGESTTVLVSLLPSNTTDNIDKLVVKNNISNVTHTVTRKSDTSMELKLTMSSTNIPTGGNIILSINGINETCTIIANY